MALLRATIVVIVVDFTAFVVDVVFVFVVVVNVIFMALLVVTDHIRISCGL